MAVSVILKSRAGLATQLQNDVLVGRIDANEALKILVAYLVRAGTITEFALPTPIE